MKELEGFKIEKLGFYPQKLGDLIYFEGPLLSLFIDRNNPDIYYLYKWVDSDENLNRWIVTQVDSLSLRNFFYSQTTLREIILDSPVSYSIELNDELEEYNIKVCPSNNLPNEYLPSSGTYFEEEKFTEFAQAFKSIIAQTKLNTILNKIISEIKAIKNNQEDINSLMSLLISENTTSYPEQDFNALLYSSEESNYEKILN